MSERFIPLEVVYNRDDFLEQMDRVASLGQFRELTKNILPGISVNGFLYDFEAQIKLHDLMMRYAHKTKLDKETPVIILKTPGKTETKRPLIGGTSASEVYRFRLHDIGFEHIYYFSQRPASAPITLKFLPTNNQAQTHEIYPLNRVPVIGGPSQSYDYALRLWQPNGQGFFTGVNQGNVRMNGVHLPRVY